MPKGIKGFLKCGIPWNKGLTKATDDRIKKYSKKLEGKKNGLGNKSRFGMIPWNKGLTKETNESLLKQSKDKKKYLQLHPELIDKFKKIMSGIKSPSKRLEVKEKFRKKRIEYIQTHPGLYKDTKPELKMKEILAFRKIPFKDQYRVEGTNHLADLYLIGTNVLIEVDGRYYHTLPGRRQRDYRFNRMAKKLGYIVLRFWDDDVIKHEEKVIKKIKNYVEEITSVKR